MICRTQPETNRNKMLAKMAPMIKGTLHAHRDCLRNQGKDTSIITWDIHDAYYGEVYGMIRTLELMGYGCLGYNPKGKFDLLKWLDTLKEEVLAEENHKHNQECDYCLKHFGKDGAGRTRI